MRRWPSATTLALLLPALLFVGLHARSLDYPFQWTDDGEILAGGMIVPPGAVVDVFRSPMLDASITRGQQSYYRPMQVAMVSLIDHHLGRRPANFRAASLLLGVATVVLFSFFAAWLFGRVELGLIAGGIAAAHPVLVQGHVWIAGSGQALSTPFLIANVWTGCIAMRRLDAGASRAGIAWALASLSCLAVALLSKESAVVAPALLLVTRLSDVRQRAGAAPATLMGVFRPLAERSAAIVGIQLLAVIWFAAVLRPSMAGGVLAGQPPLGGSVWLQVLTALGTWPGSLGWLVFPTGTTTSDVARIVTTWRDVASLGALGMLAASVVLWFELMRRGQAVAALGLAWIWLAFLPTSGLVPLTHMRATRYLHVSMYGWALLLPALLAMVVAGIGVQRRRVAILSIGGVFVGAVAWQDWVRVGDWRSSIALFGRDVERDPLYREGYHELALGYVRAERFAEARATLDALDAVRPAFEGHTSYLHQENVLALHCNLALHLGQPWDNRDRMRGMTPDSNLLRVAPFAVFQCGARSHEALGDYGAALALLEVLVEDERSPHLARYRTTGARCLARLGRDREARDWLAKVPRAALADPLLFDEIRAIRAML